MPRRAKGLEAEHAAAREQIETARPVDLTLQPVEQRLAHPVGVGRRQAGLKCRRGRGADRR